MTDWTPTYAPRGPRYLAIVDALEADIFSGRVKAGARLPPHRDMAERLDISVGTVSKAYAEAERRGLISGEVGRGTFVTDPRLARPAGAARINLALNIPPPTGADALVAAELAKIAADPALGDLLGYLPHGGSRSHRISVARWLAGQGVPADGERVLITHGAQHAISISLGLLAGQGEAVLTESVTYSGMLALARQTGVKLHPVTMDGDGVLPDALEQAFRATGARVFYTMPTLQTPTGIVTSPARRREIAAVVARCDAFVIEDDAYAFLFDMPPAPLVTLLPDRGFYAMSFAKCLTPGLRIGALIVPDAYRDRAVNALRATGWMAAPLMAEVVARTIEDGGLQQQVMRKREKAALRRTIADRMLGSRLRYRSATPGFHIWLALPEGRTLTGLISQAAALGITLASPSPLQLLDPRNLGVRLCIGSPETEDELERVLGDIRDILDGAEVMSVV